MADHSYGAKDEAAAPQYRGGDAGFARACAFHPSAKHRSRYSEKDEEQGVHPAQTGDLPITRRGEKLSEDRHVRARLRGSQAERARQRQPENTKAVSHPDAEMNAERCGWDKPSIEARCCNNAFAIKKAGHGCASRHGLIKSRHDLK